MIRPSDTPSPKTPITSLDNPSLDGVRATYRSWRDVHPGMASEKAWSIGEQASGEVPEGQVEKSIAEALAGIEPNNRSRKASHSLRFFKEGLPEEKPKKRENKDNSRPKDKLPRLKEIPPVDPGTVGDSSTSTRRGLLASSEPVTPDLSESKLPIAVDDGSISSPIKPSATTPAYSKHGRDNSILTYLQSSSEQKPDRLVAQLSEDLGKQPAHPTSAISDSLFSNTTPVVEFERRQLSEHLHGVAEGKSPSGDFVVDEPLPKERSDEDEESGEEQISSALFVPHKGSHDLPDDDTPGLGPRRESRTTSQRGIISKPEQWLVEHEVPPRETDHIAIDTSGSRQPSIISGDHIPEQGTEGYHSETSNGTDHPYDTLSDYDYSAREEESSFTDDPETTPTGRSESKLYMSKNHSDHLHRHQQRASTPLEAIELIPYRHQVGGHTTMWRFSKRAVCKQLNNRENEFYERVERYHPKLLKFMPRYVCFHCSYRI